MVRQNFQLQPIRKSSCLPFMFPEWQCRHIRGSLDSFSSSPFSSANSLFFSRARTWKIPLYSWLPIILHSSSVQSIAPRFYRSPETKPCSNLPRFDRISRTCTNLRQRSIADRLCNNPRSFVENKKRETLLLKISSLRIHPICASLGLTRFTSTCFFLPTKLTRTTFYSSTSGRNHRRSRKFHPWTCKTTSFHLSGNRTAEGTNSDKYIILMRADSSRDGSRITRSFE